jgi:hypothetical protein
MRPLLDHSLTNLAVGTQMPLGAVTLSLSAG